MDLSQIDLASFAAPTKHNNETIENGRKLQTAMTQFGMPVPTLYAIAGMYTASADALVQAGVDPEKDKVYLFLSADKWDADAETPDYVSPVSDMVVAKMISAAKGKRGLDIPLTWADRYSQVVKPVPGVTPPTPLQRVSDSPAVSAAINEAAAKVAASLAL